jgi:hypothetical protein
MSDLRSEHHTHPAANDALDNHATARKLRSDLLAMYAPRPDLAPSKNDFGAAKSVIALPRMEQARKAWDDVRDLASAPRPHLHPDSDALRARIIVATKDVRIRDYVLSSVAIEDDPEPFVRAVVMTALSAPEGRREPIAAAAAALVAACGTSRVAVKCLLRYAGTQALAALVATIVEVPIEPTRIRQLMVDAMPLVIRQLELADAVDPAPEPQRTRRSD